MTVLPDVGSLLTVSLGFGYGTIKYLTVWSELGPLGTYNNYYELQQNFIKSDYSLHGHLLPSKDVFVT